MCPIIIFSDHLHQEDIGGNVSIGLIFHSISISRQAELRELGITSVLSMS